VAVQYTKLAKTKQTINSKDLFEITKAVGKVNYTMVKANKKIGVNKNTGDIVLKSGLPKGTYTVKVRVTAAGDKNYKSGSKTVTFKVKVQ
jgi:endo-1,4-beta-xylanase